MDLGDGANSRARVMRRRFLFNRNRGRQAFDQIDIRFFHQLQKLSRIRRQRFHITTLAFCIQRIESQRRLARAGQTGDDDELVARQVEADVFQIVGAGPTNADFFHAGVVPWLCPIVLFCKKRGRVNAVNLLL